jgi:predicted aminopeptidase
MPQTNLRKIQTLEQKIAASRERLQALYDAKGYTDAEVLAAGIELDELLNQYQKLKPLKIKF